MVHPKKDHIRMVRDSCRAMNFNFFGLFATAIQWCNEDTDKKEAEREAQWLLDKFVETGVIPEWMVDDFCIPVLIGKIKKRKVKEGGFVLYEVLDDKSKPDARG